MDLLHSEVNVRRWLPILVLIVLVALGLRARYPLGFMPLDDAEYARVAHQMSQGTFSWREYAGPPVVPVRLGVVLPTAAMFKVFGPSEWSMAAYPLLLSAALLLLIFALTTKMFGHYAGLVAAGLWALFPFELTTLATSLRPDLPSTAFAFLGVFAIYVTRKRAGTDRPISLLGGGAAGLAFGTAWLCKENVIYFVPFCAIVLCHDLYTDWRRYAPVWAGVAAASLAVLGGEMVFYALQTGDWLYRFHATESDYARYPELFFAQGSRFGFAEGTYWKTLSKRLFLSGPEMIFFSPEFLYLPFFGLIAGLYGLYWKDRRFYFVTLLFVSLIVMFNFSSASLATYQPLPLYTRFFYTPCIPAAILTAGMLSTLLVPSGRRSENGNREGVFWGSVVAMIVLVVTGYGTFRIVRDATPTWASAERHLAAVLQPSDAVYTDPLTRNGLEFFWGYPHTMNISDVHNMADDTTLPCGSFVLANASYVDWLTRNHGTWLTLDGFNAPAFFKQPHSEWEKVWTNQNAQLYRVRCPAPETHSNSVPTGGGR